jgi:hypothetical protein
MAPHDRVVASANPVGIAAELVVHPMSTMKGMLGDSNSTELLATAQAKTDDLVNLRKKVEGALMRMKEKQSPQAEHEFEEALRAADSRLSQPDENT